MRDLFVFNSSDNVAEINEPDVLLIREFAALWEPERNKCKEDPTGKLRKRAFRELTYIYLMLNWKSPYSDYTEQERHQECLKDANLTEEEWADPIFRAACRKYKEVQNSSRSLKLIKSAQGIVDKITDYFDTIDLTERDEITGKPIFKTKDVMDEMKNVSKVVEELKTLEFMYKKEQEAESDVRGGAEVGFMDR